LFQYSAAGIFLRAGGLKQGGGAARLLLRRSMKFDLRRIRKPRQKPVGKGGTL
jgi:hypothetical protein